MKKVILLSAILTFLCIFSCEPDKDLITPDLDMIRKVKSTEILLRDNSWGFNDLIIDVKYEMMAIPLLANVADSDGLVQPGQYNSIAIFGNDNRQKNYTYEFSKATVNLDTTGTSEGSFVAFYNVLNATQIKVNPDSLGKATYVYNFIEEEDLFVMESDQLTNSRISDIMNKKITDAILSGKPNDIANTVIDKILENEQLQDSIQATLYDIIHGRIDAIAESPEEISEKLASIILEKLKAVDWELVVYDKLVQLLDELKVDDPEMVAQALADQLADKIETNFSQSDIYNAILPILQQFENETLPKLVPNIAEAVYKAITRAFSEENIYDKIYPIWINFSEVDSSKVSYVADTLGTVITNHFFSSETLAPQLEPFIATLRSTSTPKIPALAQEIIDDTLIPIVDSLNAKFPTLELEPDWDSIKPILTSVLTVIKSSIGDQTDTEAAMNLAESIIALMDLVISQGVENAILYLQDIPAENASQVIAVWINNLVIMAEPQIIAFLETKLTELTEMFHAEEIAEEISTAIHNRIIEIFGSDNLYELILPVMEQLSEINVEAAAEKIADWLTDMELIKDNVSEEQLMAVLTEMINQLIGNINIDEASQKLVDLILQSEVVNDIDGRILKQALELKIYEFLVELSKDINAIQKVELSIVKK